MSIRIKLIDMHSNKSNMNIRNNKYKSLQNYGIKINQTIKRKTCFKIINLAWFQVDYTKYIKTTQSYQKSKHNNNSNMPGLKAN